MNEEELISAYMECLGDHFSGEKMISEEMNPCQSCGMPLNSDEIKGTEKNGKLSEDFCIYCYNNGNFVAEMTMKDMINACAPSVADGLSMEVEDAKNKLGEFFPTLKRWKSE
jgi:hypothetical protein